MHRIVAALSLTIGLWSCAQSFDDFRGVPPPPPEPIRDFLIIPGQRIGPISVGMTGSSLYKVLGEPNRASTYAANNGRQMQEVWFGTLYARLLLQNPARVTSANTIDPRYATANGVHVGISQFGLSALVGPPSMTRGDEWCYSSGMFIEIQSGKVTRISVNTPGC